MSPTGDKTRGKFHISLNLANSAQMKDILNIYNLSPSDDTTKERQWDILQFSNQFQKDFKQYKADEISATFSNDDKLLESQLRTVRCHYLLNKALQHLHVLLVTLKYVTAQVNRDRAYNVLTVRVGFITNVHHLHSLFLCFRCLLTHLSFSKYFAPIAWQTTASVNVNFLQNFKRSNTNL